MRVAGSAGVGDLVVAVDGTGRRVVGDLCPRRDDQQDRRVQVGRGAQVEVISRRGRTGTARQGTCRAPLSRAQSRKPRQATRMKSGVGCCMDISSPDHPESSHL